MALQASEQFTKTGASIVVIIAYGTAFYLLSLVLEFMPVGIMYAIWSGLGIVLIALFGWLVYAQRLDLPALTGMAMIIAGIVVIQVFSKTNLH